MRTKVTLTFVVTACNAFEPAIWNMHKGINLNELYNHDLYDIS